MPKITYKQVVQTDRDLEVGAEVRIRWTDRSCHYETLARVVALNARSIKAAVLKPVKTLTGLCPRGFLIHVPRTTDLRNWSWQNCALPPTEE